MEEEDWEEKEVEQEDWEEREVGLEAGCCLKSKFEHMWNPSRQLFRCSRWTGCRVGLPIHRCQMTIGRFQRSNGRCMVPHMVPCSRLQLFHLVECGARKSKGRMALRPKGGSPADRTRRDCHPL